ncbi:ubiquitin protein ATG12-like [Tropilaelaps mercedesae]|uniref:Ubiquitin-like protein ATG12 n=1 Tax=Tropilaelaps mercedesae TaxID=418985 RepID=A0A1V9XY76_9ACAR|nr:ubiquitin protein ATG12-like [Tropilaelaps mercedesae]
MQGSGSSGQVVPKKVDVLLKATGDAPILTQTRWNVRAEWTIADLMVNIKKILKLQPSESLFFYVNQAFAPPLDEKLSNLHEVYATNGKLALHYAKAEAWG